MSNLWIFFNVKNFLKQNHVIFGNLTANHLTFMEMILLVNFELYKIKNLCIIIIFFNLVFFFSVHFFLFACEKYRLTSNTICLLV